MVAATVARTLADAPPSFQDLEESLTCQCGCGLTVHACNHLQCPSAIPLREEIRAQIQLGKNKQAILTYFTEKYGEKILSSPTATGFNLVAWILPFAMVGAGTLFVGIVVVRWTARGRAREAQAPLPTPVASQYEKIIEKELKDFDA
jgi:cytochrome c-type biogenesis protein CcmH